MHAGSKTNSLRLANHNYYTAYSLLSASPSSGNFLDGGKRLACTTACSAMAFNDDS